MTVAGGTWTNQNKIRPGVYIRFTSSRGLGLTVSDRGTVAIAEALSWGPVETVQTIEAGADMTPYTGYDITNANNRFLNEIFKGTNRTAAPNKVLLYRLGASGQTAATATISPLTATAKYPGTRGNDISIVITELTTPEEREKALKETVVRVKAHSIGEAAARLDPTDIRGLQRLMEAKRQLQDLEKLHISIN